jgi:hypothetical protein
MTSSVCFGSGAVWLSRFVTDETLDCGFAPTVRPGAVWLGTAGSAADYHAVIILPAATEAARAGNCGLSRRDNPPVPSDGAALARTLRAAAELPQLDVGQGAGVRPPLALWRVGAPRPRPVVVSAFRAGRARRRRRPEAARHRGTPGSPGAAKDAGQTPSPPEVPHAPPG